MRVEIGYERFHKGKDGEWGDDGVGVAHLEKIVYSRDAQNTNSWVLEIEGRLYYFRALEVSSAVEFLDAIALE